MIHAPSSVVFAGGGTGGHIFPAVAIADALLTLAPATRISFLCSTRPLDAELLAKQRAGQQPVRFFSTPAQPFSLSPLRALTFLRAWGPSVRACRDHIRAERTHTSRVVVVAMGGFVAAPAAQAAKREHAPLALVNLDAVPGLANRWIAKRANTHITSARVHAGPGTSWRVIPPIVRAGTWHTTTNQAGLVTAKRTAKDALNLDPNAHTLLVTGGSQGATSLNNLLTLLATRHANTLKGWQVIHQTGPGRELASVREAYERAGVRAIVQPFFDRMETCWVAADLALCRAGAGNVAEVWASKTPSIFFPYPYHKDQHQRFNALPLEEAKGAAICTDLIDAEANLSRHGKLLTNLLTSAEARAHMHAALLTLGPANGAEEAAKQVAALCSP